MNLINNAGWGRRKEMQCRFNQNETKIMQEISKGILELQDVLV